MNRPRACNGRVSWALALWAVSGCAAPRPRPETKAAFAVPDANFEFTVYDVVERADEEGTSYAKVFVDGALVGQTPTGPKSHDKSWSGRLSPGNRLLRVEYWILPGLGSWERLPDDYQPRERYIRIEEGRKTKLRVKFFDRARKNSMEISRDPMPQFSPSQ